MKVCCYMRVSTGMQSVENQRAILEKYVSEKGWKSDFFEEVESTRKTRPVKAAMLTRLRNGEYSGIIVVRLDRYARSSRELILEVDELLKKNIFFISIYDNLDFSTATGKLNFAILSAFSEFERNLISQRVRESLNRIKNIEGKRLGRPLGSKDKGKRRKSGYIMREARKRQLKAAANGEYKAIDSYIDLPANYSPPNNDL